ncbi:tetratricopeptide repeat protein [Novosphingobium sp. 2580]|uniref:Tetratricopeptide repeat protein n=2 Tax=Novosphingobium album (ex Hu et al. 2023) TaxID=2930093 RepID=A0ABT0B0T8_9SPHN|nr:tetratricopeptide repeat protein [Novosphingobium album (ex Hu et al. 2023)]
MQSILGIHSQRMPEVRMAGSAEPQTAMAQAEEEGRQHLDRGETGLAVESFRRALSLGAPTATTLNGMGVAFARLGRYELARHYFSQAAALDPANERYAANLTRLTRSPAFAMRHEGDLAAAVVSGTAADPVAETTQAVAAVAPPPSRLSRVSRNEYQVRTVAPSAAPLIDRKTLDSRFKPLVRIEFSKPDAFKANSSGKSVVSNPHLNRAAAAVDPSFKPIVRFNLKGPQSSEQND